MRLRILTFFTAFVMGAFTLPTLTAQNGQFDVRFITKSFTCDSSKVTIAVQVRSHDMAHTFLMGDANYRFEYDPRLINTPKIVSQEHFSNLAPSSDFNYGPQNLNGSSVTPTLGIVSLNSFYTGVASSARRVDTTWTTVSHISFNVVTGANCFPLNWHDDRTFPVTGMNEVELLNDGSFNLYVVAAGGVFTNLQACYQNTCGTTGTPPSVAVTPIVTKQDSTVTVCMPITDPDAFSTFTTSVCATAKHGTATPSVSGSQLCVNYVPASNFSGKDSVCVTVCDNTNKCVDVKIPITVNTVPRPPTVPITPIVTKQDSTVTLCLPITDPDANSTFTATLCNTPLHGTATPSVLSGGQSGNQLCINYVPTPNYKGSDSVCVRLCDNTGLCTTVTIPITVNPRPHPPVVTPTSITTFQDSTVTVCTLISDVDNNPTFNASLCGTPTGGSVSVSVVANQLCVRFVPNGTFIGQTSVCVRVCDETNLCVETTIPIVVKRRPTPPTVTPITPTVNQDSTIRVCTTITDLDSNSTFTASLCGQAANGTASPSVVGNQLCISYTPKAGYYGQDPICVRVCDNTGLCTNVTIPIIVVRRKTPPSVTVTPIETLTDTTLTRCFPITDLEGGPFTATLCNVPAGVTATPSVNGDQLCLRLTTNGLAGSSTVCVTVCDTTGLCTTVNIPVVKTVRPTPPVIDPIIPILTKEDSTATVCMPWTDATPNAPYTASICAQGARGVAVVVLRGSTICVTYTPNTGYVGTDQVCIRICETATGLCSANAIVPVTVVAKQHPPVVTVTPINTPKDSTTTVCMPITDPDPNSTFTATLCNTPLHGTATPSVSGNQLCVKYVPTPNYGGSDNVCIRVCDNTGLCTDVIIPISVDSSEQKNGLYDVRITVKDVLCDSSKANISVEVRAKTMANAFLMGDANYRFKYDPRQIRNPRLISQVNFSNIAPSRDFNYGPQNLNGSSAGTTSGLVSLNTYYTGVNQSAKRVDTTWQTISCIQFDIVQMSQCFDIKWNDGQTFPITGMSEVVVTNQNPFDYNVYIVRAGSFTNLNACPQNNCTANQRPDVTIAPQTIKEDSSFRVCAPIIDPNITNTHIVSICKKPSNGSMLAEIDNTTHQLCLSYRPNANYSGRDTVCLIICDNGTPSLCDTVVVPITIISVPDTPSVPVTPILVSRDSTVKKCFPIVDGDVPDAFRISICGVNRGQVIATDIVDRDVCITYKANNSYIGTDTICMTLCDSFGLCRRVYIPVIISDCDDTAPPVITCPAPIRVNIFGDILSDPSRFLQNARIGDSCYSARLQFGMPNATDDCGVFSVSLKSGLPSGSNFTGGIHNLVFEAMDKRGKTAACSAQIEVVSGRIISNISLDSVSLCLYSSINFSTRDLGAASYLWTGPNGFVSTSRQVSLSNVSEKQAGKYRLKVTKGFCIYEDSVYVNVIGKPSIVADVYQMSLNQTSLIAPSVLSNDTILRGARYSLKIKNGVSVGSVSFNSDGTFTYVPPVDFRGSATFTYEVCYLDCPSSCQTTTVTIKAASNQRVGGNATNVITPNGDGVNDDLVIENYDPAVDKEGQITIYNQWGDVVFRAKPYLNNWKGTYGVNALPDGTYYFVFLKTPDSEPIKDFVTIIR